jgi:hypothetical protein
MTDRELLQQALDALISVWNIDKTTKQVETIQAIKARLAQPEPEPVAWLYKQKDGMLVITDDPDYADGTWTPLYTAPPKKEWVGLTKEEARKICVATVPYVVDMAAAIEAKLKEKNT